MLVSCLCPTFNRYPHLGHLLEEAVDSFGRQDYPDRELIICNDTPGQELFLPVSHSFARKVRIFNVDKRFATLSEKIQFMIDQAQGEVLCRWDDDDIHLPHRLSYSIERLRDKLEWRAENYWYDTGTLVEAHGVGNTHIMSVWRREVLEKFPHGKYPIGHSGNEDQTFNRYLTEYASIPHGERIPLKDIFYLYRWGTGSTHLSGIAGGPKDNPHQQHYDQIGKRPIEAEPFVIHPHWEKNYTNVVEQTLLSQNLVRVDGTDKKAIPGYCNFHDFYDHMVAQLPGRARVVEVGCFKGSSLCYLGAKAKARQARIEVIGVDAGVGVTTDGSVPRLTDVFQLTENVKQCGLADTVSLMLGDSATIASYFKNHSLDWVFLDDGHHYNEVRTSAQAWFPKVRPGGWISGHDYGNPGWPQVQTAVDELFNAPAGSLASKHGHYVWVKRVLV